MQGIPRVNWLLFANGRLFGVCHFRRFSLSMNQASKLVLSQEATKLQIRITRLSLQPGSHVAPPHAETAHDKGTLRHAEQSADHHIQGACAHKIQK